MTIQLSVCRLIHWKTAARRSERLLTCHLGERLNWLTDVGNATVELVLVSYYPIELLIWCDVDPCFQHARSQG